MLTVLSSSRRSSCESRSSRPEAIRLAICRVGLVSPRSTWLSIGADTPERSARSRSERSIASRKALTRGPTAATVGSAAAVITPVRYHVQAYILSCASDPWSFAAPVQWGRARSPAHNYPSVTLGPLLRRTGAYGSEFPHRKTAKHVSSSIAPDLWVPGPLPLRSPKGGRVAGRPAFPLAA